MQLPTSEALQWRQPAVTFRSFSKHPVRSFWFSEEATWQRQQDTQENCFSDNKPSDNFSISMPVSSLQRHVALEWLSHSENNQPPRNDPQLLAARLIFTCWWSNLPAKSQVCGALWAWCWLAPAAALWKKKQETWTAGMSECWSQTSAREETRMCKKNHQASGRLPPRSLNIR